METFSNAEFYEIFFARDAKICNLSGTHGKSISP